jgi:hypothetical protein
LNPLGGPPLPLALFLGTTVFAESASEKKYKKLLINNKLIKDLKKPNHKNA